MQPHAGARAFPVHDAAAAYPHPFLPFKVFIVKKDPALTEDAVIAFCKEQLTGYKRPKYVEFRVELPKTNVGKILRRALRDEKKAA